MRIQPSILCVTLAVLLSACETPQPKNAVAMESAAAGGSPLVGRPAPDFKLPDEHGVARSLSEYRGQWLVLYFYPKDDTPGCVCQATEFTGLLTQFNEMNARVVGVSADSPQSHGFFRAKYGLKFTLLSDENLAVMRQYGAWVETPAVAPGTGRVIRSTFLIAPDGRIAYHWPEVIPQGHAQRVRDRLLEVQAAGG